ncbi:hypothetical protein [Aquella oligotrophica]|uniref:Uncharacterized protein n=1 Tax=Aquella oligotrophica TaxID=2067065 RepID=A0A2I7N4W2_9NEIS|nr:hypothetical protein [Aquella oligotrophica]AUR51499.1 hypothetical protein CUN60_04070 [Aquella oligotrophica]
MENYVTAEIKILNKLFEICQHPTLDEIRTGATRSKFNISQEKLTESLTTKEKEHFAMIMNQLIDDNLLRRSCILAQEVGANGQIPLIDMEQIKHVESHVNVICATEEILERLQKLKETHKILN